MFSSTSRPRAPSVAALRILYQLAYISSGAALGVGALCAEERRRRTAVVQKIADNARRIRQCRRYNQGATTVILNDIDAGALRLLQCDTHLASQDGAVLGPELPSVISREYRRSLSSEQHVRRRTVLLGSTQDCASADGLSQHEDASPISTTSPVSTSRTRPSTKFHQYSRQREMTLPSRSRNPGEHWQHMSQAGYRNDEPTSMEDWVPPEGRRQHMARNWLRSDNTSRPLARSVEVMSSIAYIKKSVNGQRSRSRNWQGAAALSRSDGFSIEADKIRNTPISLNASQREALLSVRTHFITRSLWTAPTLADRMLQARSLDITTDVNLFIRLSNHRITRADSLSANAAEAVSFSLLQLAIKSALLAEAQKLMMWRTARAVVTLEDVQHFASSWRHVADRSPHTDRGMVKIISDAFDIAIPKQDSTHLHAAIDLAADFFANTAVRSAALSQRYSPLQYALVHDLYESEALIRGRSFLENDQLWSAYGLISGVKFEQLSQSHARELVYSLFTHGLVAGRHEICAGVIRWTGGTVTKYGVTPVLLDEFVELASRHRASSILRDSFQEADSQLLEQLSVSSCFRISVAFAEAARSHTPTFEQCFDALSGRQKAIVEGRLIEAQAKVLQHGWKCHRNFQPTLRAYETALQSYKTHVPEDSTIALHIAMLRIANEAGQNDVSASLLRKIKGHQHLDQSALLITLLALARRQDWDLLETTLANQATQHRRSLMWTAGDMQLMVEILACYAAEHDSTQLSQFLARQTEQLGLRPSHAIAAVVIRKMVSERQSDLLDRWLEQYRGVDPRNFITGNLATQALDQLFLTHRISGQWLVKQSQELLRLAPGLACPSLSELLVKLIAREARRASVKDLGDRTQKAKMHLQQLLDGDDITFLSNKTHPIRAAADDLAETDGLVESSDIEAHAVMVADLPQDLHDSGIGSDEEPNNSPDQLESSAAHLSATSVLPFMDNDTRTQHRTTATWATDPDPSKVRTAALDKAWGISTVEDPISPQHTRIMPFGGEWGITSAQEHSNAPSLFRVDAGLKEDITSPSLRDTSSLQRPGSATEFRLRTSMLAAFSLGQYKEVTDMYSATSADEHAAASPNTLEIAVEASLRQHKSDPREAFDLLSSASKAGADVTCAVGPILLHRICGLARVDARAASDIGKDVVRYYEDNAKAGWSLSWSLAVTAANKLIHSGQPKHGVILMERLMKENLVPRCQLEISAINVLMVGYGRLRDLEGVVSLPYQRW